MWHLATDVWHLTSPMLLPSPFKVLEAFIFKLSSKRSDGATLPQHAVASVVLVLKGYVFGVLVGVPLGIAMGWSKWARRFLRPLFDLLRPIPPVGWLPVVLILFGIGQSGKVFIIFFATLMPCVLNAYSGISQTDDNLLSLARSFGAGRIKQLCFVAVPSALPQLFTGLRTALSTSWATLVAAEMLAAQKGLGFMIQTNRMNSNPSYILVAMLVIGISGAMFSALLGLLERLLRRG